MIVEVKNKSDIPYCVLNNGYRNGVNVNNVNWNSVIDYTIGKFKPKDFILDEPYNSSFDKIFENFGKDITSQSIQIAIDAKAISDPEFERILMTSDTKPILYVSTNHYVGADLYTKKGENIYGKWLTNYRNISLDNNPIVFYNTYILDRYLKTAISYEPLDSYLNLARKGYGTRYIITELEKKYKNMVDIPSKEIVENTRNSMKQIINNFKPENIILDVMKKKTRSVQVENTKLLKQQVFLKFIESVIEKYDIKYDAKKFINKMQYTERSNSIEEVYHAYQKRILKGNLRDIHKIIPSRYIPTSEYINEVENTELKGYENELPTNTSYALVDSKTSRLSLKNDTYVFNVDGKNFPSIAHYIIYNLGNVIDGFNSYNMIYNPDTNSYYTLNDTKKFYDQNMENYKNNYLTSRLIESIELKIAQHPYILDYIKSIGSKNTFYIRGYQPDITSKIYNHINKETKWRDVMSQRGNVIDFIDTDDFFLFCQKEMLESFLDIVNQVTPGEFTHNNIVKIYDLFFESIKSRNQHIDISDIEINYNNIGQMAVSLGVHLDIKSQNFLKSKFIQQFLLAENLAIEKFKTNVIYMTKFLLIESKNLISKGMFINRNMRYNYYSKELLALTKLVDLIAKINNFKVITEEHINRAYNILTYYPNMIFIQKIHIGDYYVTNKIMNSKNNEKGEVIIEEDEFVIGDNEDNEDKIINEEEEEEEDAEKNFEVEEVEDVENEDLNYFDNFNFE